MIAWAVETLVATGVLMAIVLLLRAPVRRACGPMVAYALWAIPALRMVLPPLPGAQQWSPWFVPAIDAVAASEVVFGVLKPAATPSDAIDAAWLTAHTADGPLFALVPPTVVDDGAPILALLAGVWAIGALGFIGWHLIAYARFCRRIQARTHARYRVAGGRVEVVESDAAAGPMAFGIWRRYVAFPSDFAERYDESERDLALAHELGHHARGDLAANWIALAMLGFHWFNPLAWRAFRAFRADQEMACDALVLGDRPAALRHAYGRAIVKSAHGGAVSAACHLHTINEIKGRLKMLTRHRRASRGQILGGSAGVAALTLAALGLTASGTQAAESFRDRVETSIGVELDDIKLPPLPMAPLAPAARPQDAPLPPPPVLDGPVTPPAPPPPVAADVADLARRQALENVPDIEERRCGTGTEQVIHATGAGGKQHMVICTDRIEAQAERAAAMALNYAEFAENTRKSALATAKASIAMARMSIEGEQSLTPEQRAEALAGLDQAIAEIEAEGSD